MSRNESRGTTELAPRPRVDPPSPRRAKGSSPSAPSLFVEVLASSRLALVLVVALILLVLPGALLPQESLLASSTVASWQQTHPLATQLCEPLGLFHVYVSWPFLGTIVVLAVNILACTLLRFAREGGFASFRRPGAVRRVGFLLVHLSLLGLFAGGFLSAAARMDGFVVLTEGQAFTETHEAYLQLVEAPLRPEQHRGFTVKLERVEVDHAGGRFPVDVRSRIAISDPTGLATEGVVRVNYPLVHGDVWFTQDKTGYSPRLLLRDDTTGRVLVDGFVALQAVGPEASRVHRDVLPLPLPGKRVVVELLPRHAAGPGRPVAKEGGLPQNPLLMVEVSDGSADVAATSYTTVGGRVSLGNHSLEFADLRRWSAFRVSEDPGYLLVIISLWVGVAALVLRYSDELRAWLGSGTTDRAASAPL